jgi:hypothetical protein
MHLSASFGDYSSKLFKSLHTLARQFDGEFSSFRRGVVTSFAPRSGNEFRKS